jgi:ribokinase
VAVGDVMVDVVCATLPDRDTRIHSAVAIRAGGSAVNAALAATGQGAVATVYGRVGSDAAAELVAAALAQQNIDGRLARDPDLRTGVAVALGSSVVADRGANARLAATDIPDQVPGDAMLVSGFALLQQGSAPAAHAALERFQGGLAAVDLASPKLAATADLDWVATTANTVFATADEALAVTGSPPLEAARALRGSFEIVCIKLGEDGAIAARGDHVEQASTERVERSVAFGAGDAFAATMLVALARGDSLARALALACEAGARAAAYMPMA